MDLFNSLGNDVRGFAVVEYIENGAAVFTFDNEDNCTGGFFVPAPANSIINLNNEEQKTEHNTKVVAAFMEHCKNEGLEISDKLFESYFNA
jgi:hypothetical protein